MTCVACLGKTPLLFFLPSSSLPGELGVIGKLELETGNRKTIFIKLSFNNQTNARPKFRG